MDDIKMALGQLIEKSTEVDKKLGELNKTLQRNTISLEQHEYRTTLAERKLDLLKEEIDPIRDHVKHVEGIGKAIKWVSWSTAAITGLVALFKFLSP